MINKKDCPYLESGKFCVHVANHDRRTRPSVKNNHLKRKRCLECFCPFRMEE